MGGSGFRVQDLGLRVWGLGSKFQGLGSKVGAWCFRS